MKERGRRRLRRLGVWTLVAGVTIVTAGLAEPGWAATVTTGAAGDDIFSAAKTALNKPAGNFMALVKWGGVFAVVCLSLYIAYMKGKVNWAWIACLVFALICAARADLVVNTFWGSGNPFSTL